MCLQINLPEDVERSLKRPATEKRSDPESCVLETLQRAAISPWDRFRELAAPLQKAFRESGETDDKLGDFLEKLKHELRRENGHIG